MGLSGFTNPTKVKVMNIVNGILDAVEKLQKQTGLSGPWVAALSSTLLKQCWVEKSKETLRESGVDIRIEFSRHVPDNELVVLSRAQFEEWPK